LYTGMLTTAAVRTLLAYTTETNQQLHHWCDLLPTRIVLREPTLPRSWARDTLRVTQAAALLARERDPDGGELGGRERRHVPQEAAAGGAHLSGPSRSVRSISPPPLSTDSAGLGALLCPTHCCCALHMRHSFTYPPNKSLRRVRTLTTGCFPLSPPPTPAGPGMEALFDHTTPIAVDPANLAMRIMDVRGVPWCSPIGLHWACLESLTWLLGGFRFGLYSPRSG
jgi:hypothetical protein